MLASACPACGRTSAAARTVHRPRARRCGRPSSWSPARNRARAGSSLVGGAVGCGDQLEQMPIGILEIDATAAVVMIDLARALLVRAGIDLDAVLLEAGEAFVGLPVVAHGVVMLQGGIP